MPTFLNVDILFCLCCRIEKDSIEYFDDDKDLPITHPKSVDDMGVWKHTGSPSQYFRFRKNKYGGMKEIVSLGKKSQRMSNVMYRIKNNYNSHHTASDLSRTVIFVEGN